MRCAVAGGAEVYLLGSAGARGLRFSRYCARFMLSDRIIHGGRDERLALEINCLCRDLGIGMVMAGDAPSTRALIAVRDLIDAKCFPMPSLEVFDELNDKWRFAQICTSLGIRQPATRLLPDVQTLERELAAGRVRLPAIAKPLDRSGASGVIALTGVDTKTQLAAINYQPILVQEFIAGEDIGASMYAMAGRVEAIIAHQFERQTYQVLDHSLIVGELETLARHFELDGVYNFDMRLAPDGEVYFLECNPRVFYKINLSMLAGINFVAYGMPGICAVAGKARPARGSVRLPKALALSIITSAKCTQRDWAMAGYLWSDPVPYLMELMELTV
jgi:ATP-grasp in the biosynthetic pathway with Ter operon